MIPKIIGEGTYGCVTNPSVRCTKKVNYKNKVSKIMHKKYAMREYNELKKITKIPGITKYILSLPEMCTPKINEQFKSVVQTCENSKFSHMKDDSFRLLVFENGGINLSQFMKNVYFQMKDKTELNIFWTNILKLIDGLIFFKTNHIVHHDLKAQNIVYNVETGDMKFIDFGKMKKKSEIIKLCKNNQNHEATKWFNYPPEYEHANQIDFEVNQFKYSMNYTAFVEKLIITFDSYSIGNMMMEMLKKLMDYSTTVPVSKEFYKDSIKVFSKIGDPDIQKRDTDLVKTANDYKSILEYYDMYIPNHTHSLAPNLKQKVKKYEQYTLSQPDLKTLKKVLYGGYYNPIYKTRRRIRSKM